MYHRKFLSAPIFGMAASYLICALAATFASKAWAQADADGDQAPRSPWLEAGDTEDEPGTHIRTYSVLLDDEGNVSGKLFRVEGKERKRLPAPNIKLFVVQEGEVLTEGESHAEDGTFKLGPLKPGIYSLIGKGQGGLVAFSLNVVSPEEAEDAEDADKAKADEAAEPDKDSDKPKPLLLKEIETCALDPEDMPMALQLIKAFLGVGSGGQPAEEPELKTEEAEPADQAAQAEEPADQAEMPADQPAKPSRTGRFRGPVGADAIPSTTLAWEALSLQKDGSFVGMMRMLEPSEEENEDEEHELKWRPPVDMRVFFIKDGKVVAQAPCSKKGYFVIEHLKPDLYSFVSVGVDAFSATTVDVLPAPKEEDGEKKAGDEAADRGGVRPATIRLVSFARLANGDSTAKFDAAGVPVGDSRPMNVNPLIPTQTPDTIADVMPTAGDSGSGGDGGASGSGLPGVGGAGGSAPGGGSGGGAPGGGGGVGGIPNGEIPEIDPASAGVGLSVLIGLMLLLIDLFRPR